MDTKRLKRSEKRNRQESGLDRYQHALGKYRDMGKILESLPSNIEAWERQGKKHLLWKLPEMVRAYEKDRANFVPGITRDCK